MLKNAEGSDNASRWQTLRDVCARLSAGLREHMQREEKLSAPHGRSLGAAALETDSYFLNSHYGDYRYLQVIARYVTSEDRPFLLNNRYQLLTNFVRGLHRHIDEQELVWNR